MKAFGLARLGRDTELRTTQNGEQVATLSLAFTRRAKGEKVTDWVDAALWGKRAESLSQYLTKGTLIAVTLDDLHIETYEGKNGEGHKLSARVIDVELAGGNERPAASPAPRQAPAKQPAEEDLDSDIPF